MSGETVTGSAGVPIHRLANPEGNKPVRHALFLPKSLPGEKKEGVLSTKPVPPYTDTIFK